MENWKKMYKHRSLILGITAKIIRDMICEYVDLSLNLHHEEGDSYTKRR